MKRSARAAVGMVAIVFSQVACASSGRPAQTPTVAANQIAAALDIASGTVQTDRQLYSPRDSILPGNVRSEFLRIIATYSNLTAATHYIPVQGVPSSWALDRWLEGEWVSAYGLIPVADPDPPRVVPGGAVVSDTIRVEVDYFSAHSRIRLQERFGDGASGVYRFRYVIYGTREAFEARKHRPLSSGACSGLSNESVSHCKPASPGPDCDTVLSEKDHTARSVCRAVKKLSFTPPPNTSPQELPWPLLFVRTAGCRSTRPLRNVRAALRHCRSPRGMFRLQLRSRS